jgi:Flp pilus assembly protein TadG
MSRTFINRKALRVRHFARRLVRSIEGAAAIEFGYIAPIMLVMLLGTFEVSRAIAIDRRLGMVTSMVADLVAREENMTADDLNKIYEIVDLVMQPYNTDTLKLSVIPVKASSTNETNTRVYAGATNRPVHNGGTVYPACASYTLTPGLVAKGASVIVVESSYNYEPVFVNSIIGPVLWREKATLSPRNSCVDFDNDNCVSTCF